MVVALGFSGRALVRRLDVLAQRTQSLAAATGTLLRCSGVLDRAATMAVRFENADSEAGYTVCSTQIQAALQGVGDVAGVAAVSGAVADLVAIDRRLFAHVRTGELGRARELLEGTPRDLLSRSLAGGSSVLVARMADGGSLALRDVGPAGALAAAAGAAVLALWVRRTQRRARLDATVAGVAYDQRALIATHATETARLVAAHGALSAALGKQLREKVRALAFANATLQQHKNDVNDALNYKVSSEAMSRTIIDHAVDGILAVESDGRVCKINPAGLLLLGYRVEEVVGQPLTLIFPDEDFGSGKLAGDRSEVSARRKDGRRIPVALHLSETRLAHLVLFVGSMRDLSPVRAAQSELDTLNARLMDASRSAGRADVAASVLHNIGNVLNSINVSTAMLREGLHSSEIGSVKRIADLLAAQQSLSSFFASDPRAAHIPAFLAKVGARLISEQGAFAGNLGDLGKQIDHIKAVIGMQEAHAGLSSLCERLAVQSVVDDALAINRAGLAKTGVTVVREFEDLPQFFVDRHRVLQILVNLLRNAQHAVADLPGERVVTLRVARRGAAAAVLQVIDNGVGITTENLAKVFQQGFTTKSFGHGYGMHSSAIAARSMGGALTAASDGPGCGATMTLEIPMKLEEEVQRAA